MPPENTAQAGSGSPPSAEAAPGGLLANLFPITQPPANQQGQGQAQPPPVAANMSAAPVDAPPPAASPAQPPPAAEPGDPDDLDLVEVDNTNVETVAKSYAKALSAKNREAKGLRTKLQTLQTERDQATQQLTVAKEALIPSQRELTYYRSIVKGLGDPSTPLGQVLYPDLLWQAISGSIQWDGINPKNLNEAVAAARTQYPALFLPVANAGGSVNTQAASGGFDMNAFIRGKR